jgi:transcriptional regulator with XRE-family HTH domain
LLFEITCEILLSMREPQGPNNAHTVEVARDVLKETLQRGPLSLDEIGRRMGHVRGYMSRALRGANALTLDTMTGALDEAGIDPAGYFAAVAEALRPTETDDDLPSQEQIEATVMRTLRRLGWLDAPGDRGKGSGRPR